MGRTLDLGRSRGSILVTGFTQVVCEVESAFTPKYLFVPGVIEIDKRNDF